MDEFVGKLTVYPSTPCFFPSPARPAFLPNGVYLHSTSQNERNNATELRMNASIELPGADCVDVILHLRILVQLEEIVHGLIYQ